MHLAFKNIIIYMARVPGPVPNPLDLTQRRGGNVRPALARTFTDAEIAKKLEGYLEVPPDNWHLVKAGTHVRYYTHADGFKSGGLVAKNPTDTTPQGANAEKRFMRLQSGYNERAPGYFSWVIAYEDLARLFIKPDAGALTVMASLEEAVRGLNENIRKLADYAKGLSNRITALEQKL